MRRLLFALIPVLMTVTPVGAAKADSIKVILKGPEEETAVSASFAVFQDSACKKPVKENDRDMVVTVNEDGFIPDDLDENLYLREASAPAGYYLSRETFSVKEAEKEGITVNHSPILYVISAEEPYPAKYIYDENGEPADDDHLTAGRKYYVSADSRSEWNCYPASEMNIPLYDEGIVEAELTEGSYGNILMKEGQGSYAVYTDSDCRERARDIHGVPASVSPSQPASVSGGVYYLKQEEGEWFFPDEAVHEINAAEKTDNLFQPEQKSRSLTVSAVDQNGNPAAGEMKCIVTDEEGSESEYAVTSGKGTIPLYRPGTLSLRMEDLPAGYCGSTAAEYTAVKEEGQEAHVSITLQAFDLRIQVYDEQLEKTVPGVSFTLSDSQGKETASWKSSDDAAGDIPAKEGKKAVFRPGETLSLHCSGEADHYFIPAETEIVIPEEIEGGAVKVVIPARRYITAGIRMVDERGEEAYGARAAFYTDSGCTEQAADIYGNAAEAAEGESTDLWPGTYYIRQTENAEGCYRNEEVSEVWLNESSICTLQCRRVGIDFVLTDACTGESLSGGLLSVSGEDGNVLGEVDLSVSARTDFMLEPDTDYTVSVIQPPAYHLACEDISVHTGADEDVVAEMKFIPYVSLSAEAKDSSGEALKGGKYSLYTDPECLQKAKSVYGEEVSGVGGLQADLAPGMYYLKEETPPDYCWPQTEPMVIELMAGSGQAYADIVSERASVILQCIDSADGHPLSGTVIEITSDNGSGSFETEVDEEGTVLYCSEEGLKTGDTYRLKVTKPAYMHTAEEEVTFTVPAERPQETETVTVTEEPYAAVLVQKKGGVSALSDIRLEVFADSSCSRKASDISGNEAGGVTDQNGEVLWYLKAGDYWLKEEEGLTHWYRADEPLQFTVKPLSEPSVRIISESQEASFCISVSDPEGNCLSGAEVEVYDDNEDLVASFVSTEEPHLLHEKALKPSGVYTVHQKKAAEGYERNSTDIEFVMPETAPVQTPVLTIRNERLRASKSGRSPGGKDRMPLWPLITGFLLCIPLVYLLYRRLRG